MNRELRGLLVEAGFPGATDPDAWSRMIVLKNRGAVPLPADVPPDTAQRGFKLLLLDGRGRCSGFGHCAAADDSCLERETRILETLCALPGLAHCIPRTRSARSPRLRLQVTDFIPGQSYASMIHHQSPSRWAQAAHQILSVSELVTRLAGEVLPDLLGPGESVDIAEAAGPRLDLLAAAGAPRPYVDTLRSVLAGIPTVPRRIQHGDLWPGNVLWYHGSWWFIDFAEFGLAQIPMYDVFLFVHHTWLMLSPRTAGNRWARASRQVVATAAERLGVSQAQAVGGMLYYLIHLSSYRLRHGVGHAWRAQFFRVLLELAELLRDGVALENLPLPWERMR